MMLCRPFVVFVTVTLSLSAAHVALAQPSPGTPSSIRANVERLADDALEGRFTGGAGIRQAADLIIDELEAIG